MRTFDFLLSAAVIALGLVSCNKEESVSTTGHITFAASIESGVDTRTSLSGNDTDGYQVLWSEGDKISLIKDATTSVFTLAEGAGSTCGTFEGTYLSGDGKYEAFYGTDGHWLSDHFEYNGPDKIAFAPMAAEVTIADGVATATDFRNICGLLRLTLKGHGMVKEIKVHAGQPLNGPFKVEDGSAVIQRTYGTDNYVNTLSCGNGVGLTAAGKDFFIPLPQNEYDHVKIEITDFIGNTCTKSLKEGKILYISRAEITPVSLNVTGITSLPAGALKGEFTVNEQGKKVHFSRGNLYWDGDSFEFEENQDAYLSSRTENHVDHFYWAKEASAARTAPFYNPGFTSSDVLFTNAGPETPGPAFTVNGMTGRYRALSADEWSYLFSNHRHNWVTVNGVGGMVIAPDGYDGGLKGSYSRDELADGNLVFLPAAVNVLNDQGQVEVQCEYWSSTPTQTSATDGKAYCIHYRYNGLDVFEDYRFTKHCTSGISIRLVADKLD